MSELFFLKYQLCVLVEGGLTKARQVQSNGDK